MSYQELNPATEESEVKRHYILTGKRMHTQDILKQLGEEKAIYDEAMIETENRVVLSETMSQGLNQHFNALYYFTAT